MSQVTSAVIGNVSDEVVVSALHTQAGACEGCTSAIQETTAQLANCPLDDYLANDDVVYSATQIFDALSDSTRFQILGVLVRGSASVTELQDVCHVSQSAISHQLRLLRDRGLVSAKREGQRMIYQLTDEHVGMLLRIGLMHAAEDIEPGE